MGCNFWVVFAIKRSLFGALLRKRPPDRVCGGPPKNPIDAKPSKLQSILAKGYSLFNRAVILRAPLPPNPIGANHSELQANLTKEYSLFSWAVISMVVFSVNRSLMVGITAKTTTRSLRDYMLIYQRVFLVTLGCSSDGRFLGKARPIGGVTSKTTTRWGLGPPPKPNRAGAFGITV